MKTVMTAMIVAALATLGGCVAVPTRHGLLVAPIAPVVHVGVGYGYGYGPYYRQYR